MTMRTYARIQDGLVAELLSTDHDIITMFNPTLVWVDVSSVAEVAEGWTFDGTNFIRPSLPPPPHPPPPVPTIAELKARLAALGAQIAALSQGE